MLKNYYKLYKIIKNLNIITSHYKRPSTILKIGIWITTWFKYYILHIIALLLRTKKEISLFLNLLSILELNHPVKLIL